MRRVTLEGAHDGPTNMGRDLTLLSMAESNVASARVYAWEGAWVSLGRFQSPQRALKPGATVSWVSRPTGGKAVLHGHDVTVGLALPLSLTGLPEGTRSVGPVYRVIVEILVQALKDCGVQAELGERTRFVKEEGRTADCFAHVSPNDIVDPLTGQKVCGCALRLSEKAVLVQASIPASRPLVDPADVFDRPSTVSWRPLAPDALSQALESALGAVTSNNKFSYNQRVP